MRFIKWTSAPADATPVQKKNFQNVEIDAIGVGMASPAAQFLPVFLTRLGATNFQIGLLSSMPAATGLFLAIIVGRFLQKSRQVVPWYSAGRLMVLSTYAATGLLVFFVPSQYLVPVILVLWALATVPQNIVGVGFSVVMNAVAGPKHRYDLLSRRWSILGLTTAITALLAGQVLVRINFPINYQLVFIGLSLGGLLSYFFSRQIVLPDLAPPQEAPGETFAQRLKGYGQLINNHPAFVQFSIKRFVYLSGVSLAAPLFPLYFVRVVEANDAWISYINTTLTTVLLVGYFLWPRLSRKRGSRFVLLSTTLGMSLYPFLVALTHDVGLIVLLAGMAGIFQAGLDLVFFDELMKTVPAEYSATFVSLAQSLQYLSAVIAPLLGTALANGIGLGYALMISALLRLSGFLLFALWNPRPAAQAASS